MADIYVLVHGAWHTGELLEPVARYIREMGHIVHCPTLTGNRPDDDRATSGLSDAVASLVEYLDNHDLSGVRLVGHSYGGMVISKVADMVPQRLTRLVYWNAFVPLNGECLNDMVPAHYTAMFEPMAASAGNAVMLPFPVWREVFVNDADMRLAESSFAMLNPHPYRTFTDRISLKTELAALQLGKSYLNFQQDVAMPHGMPWHPRLSERLGLFRLVEGPGGHEVCFTNPELAARKVVEAGRD